jgi:toxin-antitoxin system PIN domain toxin
MSRPALLDVNVLVALFDPDHVHHEAAHAWFSANRDQGWATCPLTENGLIRILANAAYSGIHEPCSAVRDRLNAFCASGQHLFWKDELSIRDARLFRLPAAVTHRHMTDIYLLGLASSNGGRLATFDRRIPLSAVVDASSACLEFISA